MGEVGLIRESALPLGAVRDAAPRYQWLDAAKGIGIILVVAGHVCGGLIDSRLPTDGVPIRPVFVGVYLFHMPLFFMLSGLLIERRVSRDSRKFLVSIGTKIAYPYFLWSVIQFSCISAAASLVNTPPGDFWAQILHLPVWPVSQFWFFYALALMHAMSWLVLPRYGPAALLLLSLVIRSLADLQVLPGILGEAGSLFPYYAVGVLLAPQGVETLVMRKRPAWVELILVALACSLLVFTARTLFVDHGIVHPASDDPWLPAALLAGYSWSLSWVGAALALTAAVLTMAERAAAPLKSALAYLGRLSLPIFVLHILFIAGLRIVLTKLLQVQSLAIIVPAIFAAGLLGPLVTFILLERVRLAKPLGLS